MVFPESICVFMFVIPGAVELNLSISLFKLVILLFKSLNWVSIVLIPVKKDELLVKLTFPFVKSSITTPLEQAKF